MTRAAGDLTISGRTPDHRSVVMVAETKIAVAISVRASCGVVIPDWIGALVGRQPAPGNGGGVSGGIRVQTRPDAGGYRMALIASIGSADTIWLAGERMTDDVPAVSADGS